MPTYEYECRRCRHRFERFQRMSDPKVRTCPKCRGPVKRLMGAGAGLIFKGSGFYITDYKKSGSSPAGSGASKSADAPAEKAPAANGKKPKEKNT